MIKKNLICLSAVLLLLTGRVDLVSAQAYYNRPSACHTYGNMPFFFKSIGLRINQAKPMGNFGADFSKTAAFELFLETEHDDNDRFHGNISFRYARFKPRLDTIPVYLVEGTNMMSYRLYPGQLAYKNAVNMTLVIDYSYVLVRKGKFDLALGAGMGLGKIGYAYYERYETKSETQNTTTDFTFCLQAQSNLTYKVTPLLQLRASLNYQWQTVTDWSLQLPGRYAGIGLVVNFKKEEQ